MNEAPQVEVVDLGDATDVTKGSKDGHEIELNQVLPYYPEP